MKYKERTEDLEHEKATLERKLKRLERAYLLERAENVRLRRMIEILMEEKHK